MDLQLSNRLIGYKPVNNVKANKMEGCEGSVDIFTEVPSPGVAAFIGFAAQTKLACPV